MKILIVTPRVPYPPHRGDKLRMFNIISNFPKEFSQTIITLYSNKKELLELEQLRSLGYSVVGVKQTLFDTIFGLFSSVFSGLPFQCGYFHSSSFKTLIAKEIQTGNFDFAYFHLIRTIQFAPADMGKTLPILDLTDAVSMYLSKYLSIEKNFFKRVFFSIELRRVKKYEKNAERFRTVLLCSENDKSFLNKQYPAIKTRVVSNGINVEVYKPNDEQIQEENRILFTGNIPYFPNHDAVLYFTEVIFPQIIKKNPKVKFYIVGQNPTAKVRALASDSIIVTGFVQDIKAEYLKSKVNIAPIRFGAGTPNKIMESIALGIPVVATTIAVQGFDSVLRDLVFCADSPSEFADTVLRLLNPSESDKTRIREASDYIRKELDLKKILADFSSELKNYKTSNN